MRNVFLFHFGASCAEVRGHDCHFQKSNRPHHRGWVDRGGDHFDCLCGGGDVVLFNGEFVKILI